MAQTFYQVGGMVGVDLNNQSTTQLFALGTHVLGTQNSEWVYINAATSVSGLSAVAINAAGTGGMASGGDLTAGRQLALAQTSISAQAFGWVAIRGLGLTVATTGSSSATSSVFLAASGTPTGTLSSAATGSGTLAGVSFTDVANQTATATFTTCNLTWPRGAAVGL